MKKIVVMLSGALFLSIQGMEENLSQEKKSPTLPRFLAKIPSELQEKQKNLIEALKIAVAKRIDPSTNLVVSKELIQKPVQTYKKPEKKTLTSMPQNEIDQLLKDLESPPNPHHSQENIIVNDPLCVITELEDLTEKLSIETESFADESSTINQDHLSTLCKTLNHHTDRLAQLSKLTTNAKAKTALRRLNSFVSTMQETRNAHAQQHTVLTRLTIFNRYSTSLASLSETINDLMQP